LVVVVQAVAEPPPGSLDQAVPVLLRQVVALEEMQ
jgi:hypothetical protein